MASFHIIINTSMPLEGKVPSIALMGRDRYNGVRAIKAGFCWDAFLCSMLFLWLWLMFGAGSPILTAPIWYGFSICFFIWAGAYRMWLLGFVGAIIIIAPISPYLIMQPQNLGFMIDLLMSEEWQILDLTFRFVMIPFLAVIIPLKANKWRVMGEKKRGYKRVDTIEDASSKKDAVRKYLIKNSIPLPISWLPSR